jgi:hypothetical protein
LGKNATEPIEITGVEENLKESPIGNSNKFSCFSVIASKIKYRGVIEFLNQKVGARTCIEAYSDNKKRNVKVTKPIRKQNIKDVSAVGKTHHIRKSKK